MDIKEAMQLKFQGILNLDNCICVNRYTDTQVLELKAFIESQGQSCKILDFSIDNNIKPNECPETTALRYLYTMQRYVDMILRSRKLFIIKDIYLFYQNYIVDFLKKSNPSFLCWYLSYNINCNPIIFLDTNQNANNYGLINIISSDPIEGFKKGLQELKIILDTKK